MKKVAVYSLLRADDHPLGTVPVQDPGRYGVGDSAMDETAELGGLGRHELEIPAAVRAAGAEPLVPRGDRPVERGLQYSQAGVSEPEGLGHGRGPCDL